VIILSLVYILRDLFQSVLFISYSTYTRFIAAIVELGYFLCFQTEFGSNISNLLVYNTLGSHTYTNEPKLTGCPGEE
jgi:hypothetical protein